MAPKGVRRGVLMTASARKPRASWRDEPAEQDSPGEDADSSDGEALAAKASQREWDDITREVREEKRKRHAETEFSMGRREVVAGYDDVADDAVEPERPPAAQPADALPAAGGVAVSDDAPASAPAATAAAASAATIAPGGSAATAPSGEAVAPPPLRQPVSEQLHPEESEDEEAKAEEEGARRQMQGPSAQAAGAAAGTAPPKAERELPPEGAITAGKQEESEKKKQRGGKKKTGSQKKRDREEANGEDGDKPWKKRKRDEDEDDGKWLKLKLDGEEKTKRIKAARIVSYFDFDSGGALFHRVPGDGYSSSSGSTLAAIAPASAPGVDAPSAQEAPAAAASSAAPAAPPPAAAAAGNFRSGLRLDLWEDDSEE